MGCWWISSRSGWLLELLTELTNTEMKTKTKTKKGTRIKIKTGDTREGGSR